MSNGRIPIAPVSKFPEGFIRRLAIKHATKDNDPKKIDSKEEWRMLEEAVSRDAQSNLSHWGLLMEIKRESLPIVQISVTPRELLQRIGTTYEINHDNGMKTMASVLTYKGVKALGIDFKEVFKDCGSSNTDWNENEHHWESNPYSIINKKGYLVNLDLYQQVALLKAIAEKLPKDQRDNVSLYNLRASMTVHETVGKETLKGLLGVWWMWTGQRHLRAKYEVEDYPDDAMVNLKALSSLADSRFCFLDVKEEGKWVRVDPNVKFYGAAVIIGARIE